MYLEYFTEPTAFDVLIPEWQDLHQRSRTATVFNSPQWCRVWWCHFGTPGTLHLMTARTDDGRLAGVAPLYNTTPEGHARPQLRFIGGVDVSDYLDVLVAPGHEQPVIRTFLQAWSDSSCSCTLDLHALREDSPTRRLIVEGADALGMEVATAVEDICPVVSLPSSWDAYLESLDSKDRHELRRKLRKAGAEALITWHGVHHCMTIKETLPAFFELHQASDPSKRAFMTPEMRAFFEEMAVTLAACGWLWLTFLLVNGEPAATYLLFDFRDEILVYNSGYDPSHAEHLSPGWMLLGYLIEHSISLGRRRFDFLRGDEEYKFRFGATPEPVYHLEVVPRGVR